MILARAPFRVSFAGGGSDLKAFYSKSEHGAVFSTAINKYMYIMIHPYFHDKIRIKYSKTEDVKCIKEIRHPLARECLKLMGIKKGIEIASIADVPAGTGLGSSSAFTVCFLQALHAYADKPVAPEILAREACRIEIDILKEPIGKQDQYAAAYGGLNYIRFNRDETVFIEPLTCEPVVREALENNLLMFYVGHPRKASRILKEEKKGINQKDKQAILEKMVDLAGRMRELINSGKVKSFGELLHEEWLLKKKLATKISNPQLDKYYEKALKAGASGGKILGAGGGGFFLFYCLPKNHNKLRNALKLRELEFKFAPEGSMIIHKER